MSARGPPEPTGGGSSAQMRRAQQQRTAFRVPHERTLSRASNSTHASSGDHGHLLREKSDERLGKTGPLPPNSDGRHGVVVVEYTEKQKMREQRKQSQHTGETLSGQVKYGCVTVKDAVVGHSAPRYAGVWRAGATGRRQ